MIQLREAYRRDRSDRDTLLFLGVTSLSTGQMNTAGHVIQQGHSLDPLDPLGTLLVSYHHFFEGRFENAAVVQERSLQLGPEVVVIRLTAVRTFISAGELSRAEECARHFKNVDPYPPMMEAADFFLMGLSEKIAHMPEVSKTLRSMASQDSELAQYLSDAYAFGGDGEKALEWLEIALRNGFMNHVYLSLHDPFIAAFRDLTEWKEVLGRVKKQQKEYESKLTPLLRDK